VGDEDRRLDPVELGAEIPVRRGVLGRRDENLAAAGHQGWFPARSSGTICDKP
jgi:hypothetical protein